MRPAPEDIVQAVYDAAQKGLRVVVGGDGGGSVELGTASLSALVALLASGTPEQHTGQVDVTPQTVDFSGPSRHVTVLNPTKNATLEVSFDGGQSYVQLPGPGVLSVPCRATGVRLRSMSDTLPYGVIAAI